MSYKIFIGVFTLLISGNVFSQALPIQKKNEITAVISLDEQNKISIINADVLTTFFNQLKEIEKSKNGKVRMVQVGDSHIQADFSSNMIKDIFQQKFGNAGLGFVFPHRLAKTNGTTNVNFKSNAVFLSSRNVRPANEKPIGIAGYSLTTTNEKSVIQVAIKNEQDYVNSIKILTPNNEKFFDLGLSNGTSVNFQNQKTKAITHKVKRNETLSSIANKYNVSVDYLKKLNTLKTSKIAVGKILKIRIEQQVATQINTDIFKIVDLINDGKSNGYNSKVALDTFYLITTNQPNDFTISGLVLENDKAGITYSGIGVNGAKLSDYNNFDMFFDQMKVLNPNLLIVSLGTNESFDRLPVEDYMYNLEIFVEKMKKSNPNVVVLVTTPPPSTLHRKYENTFIADYTQGIIDFARKNKTIAVFDMYQALGGLNGVNQGKQKGFLAKDEVHYTKNGYEEQGQILADALLDAYQNYISNK